MKQLREQFHGEDQSRGNQIGALGTIDQLNEWEEMNVK